MTELMTPVIFRGLICDWPNEKTLRKGRVFVIGKAIC